MTPSTHPPEQTQKSPNTETVDELRGFDLRIAQPRDGYRYSLDPFLLADFARPATGERVLDLGTGCGIIPLLLARQATDCSFVGVERQPLLAELAGRNARENRLIDRISIITADLLDIPSLLP